MLNRRSMLQATTIGAGHVAVGSGLVGGLAKRCSTTASGAVRIRMNERKVISQEPELYCGWPTLAKKQDGELLLVYSGGRESHVCPFGRVELMRSRDGGQTWSWPQVVLDGPIDDRDAGIVEAPDGSILITTFTSLAYQPQLLAARRDGNWDANRLRAWNAAHDRVDEEARQQALGVWMTRSDNNGVTWSGRYDCLVNSPHGPIALADGRLIYAGKDLWREGSRVGVCLSTDNGASWGWLAEIPTREGDRHQDYHELHVAECANGRLVCHIRNHNSANSRETLQSVSDDGGESWSTPASIGVWGLPSHLLKLADGRLMMSYGYRRQPFGNEARISSDHGETWSDPIKISDDGVGGDLGYPSTVQREDGRFVSVWYEKLASSSRAVLRQATWELED